MKIPQPEAVLKDLGPILPVLITTLKEGTARVGRFFDDEQAPIDLVFAPHLVRWQGKRFLDHAGHRLVIEADDDYDREELGGNGLLVSYRQYRVRVRKSVEGELPLTGFSKRLKYFYDANQLWFEFPSDGHQDQKEITINLVLLWDVAANYTLTRVRVALPKRGGRRRALVEAYWYAEIPIVAGKDVLAELLEDIGGDLDEIKPLPLAENEDEGTEPAR